MYETFRDEMIYKLRGMDPITLSTVISALDEVACGYTISKSETALTVIGKDHFVEIVSIYMIVRKTEGLSDGTLEHVGRIMRQFINDVAKSIEEVQTNDIRAFLFRYQRTRGISNRTLDQMRSIICTFFCWAAAEGYITTNPAATVRPIKYARVPRKALTQKELEIVRRAVRTDRDLAIVEMLYSTGCRVAELCSILMSDVDWNKREITILGKGGKYRTVYINAKAEYALEIYLGSRKHNSAWLFCNDRGGGQMKPSNIQRIFSSITEKTGIIVSPHIMRHTMATQALRGGTGIELVQRMLGHSDISTTMIYAEVDQSCVHSAHLKSVI